MKRSPLERKTRLRARRPTPRRSARVHDLAYLARVRQLPCHACGRSAPSEADHQGPRPFGRKADDVTAVPMCRECHQRRTDGFLPSCPWSGVHACNSWSRAGKDEIRVWCDVAVEATQRELGLAP